MIPSNSFAYNFNSSSINTFGQLSVNHHHPPSHQINSQIDIIDNHQNDQHGNIQHLDDNIQHSNQLYELHSSVHNQHQLAPSQNNYSTLSGNNINHLDNSNEELPVISLFKLKNFLNQPKKSSNANGSTMQSMFSSGQELSSSNLQLLTSDNGMGNAESNLNQSSLQSTSTHFYNNLAPSAIGSSAIVTTPMLLSQTSDSLNIDSNRNPTSLASSIQNNNHLINFDSSLHLLSDQSTQHSQLSSINLISNSNGQNKNPQSRSLINSKEIPLRKFTCKYCNETFQSKGEMQIHYTGHHREPKPFKCPYDKCTKRFQKTNYLKQHLRIHTMETPFHCTMCDRKFKQQSHRNQHIRTHTGAKPYKCKYADCDKCFSQESNLRSHMRSHESGRPFKCNSCHLTFEDELNLLAHIPKHRETKHTKVYICDFCGKSYSQELYLSKHIQQKHADKIDSKIPSSINQSPNGNISLNKSSIDSNLNNSMNKANQHLKEINSPSNSPSSTSSSIKSNTPLKSKKIKSSPGSNCIVQNTSSSAHIINYPDQNASWTKAGTSSPDSTNSNCISSSNNSELGNLSSASQLQQSDSSMFAEVNNSLSSRYDSLQSVDLFYNHPNNTMSNTSQHQSAFTALGRSCQSSPKYFNNPCDNFVFNKPQYSSSNQLHSLTNQQSSLSVPNNQQLQVNQQTQIHHAQDGQLLQQNSHQSQPQLIHQLSPLSNHISNSSHNLAQNPAQTSPVHLQHLHHSQNQQNQNQHSQQHQLIALNQIRNYACMPNSGNTILQPQSNPNSSFVNNIFLNAQNNNSSMSACNDYPIMILQ